MDDLQRRLASIGLRVAAAQGFVLGGGHAVQLHGMGARPSEDIDLFSGQRGGPGEIKSAVVAAFKDAGVQVSVTLDTPDLVQMIVTATDGHTCKVDLGVFWQAHSPVVLEVGPVLHPDDAVAGKMDALFNRWAPRDFLDVDAILTSGRYTRERLIEIAAHHNPGFDVSMFAEALSYLRRIPDRDFLAYGATDSDVTAMRNRFAEWEHRLMPGAD